MPIIVGPGSPGTLIELSAVWLNDALDPTDCQAFTRAGETLSASTTAAVVVRQLIGRRRSVRTGSTTAESVALSFEQCTPTQVAWLRDHVGVAVCCRDHVGGKFFGVYVDVPREVSTAYRDRSDVKITLESITYDESV